MSSVGPDEMQSPSARCELIDIVREVLSHNGDRFSVEVQKLCFYADLYAVERYGRRLTDVEYGAYMYGPYSEEITDALEAAESEEWLETIPGMRDGRPDTKYDAADGAEIADGCRKIVEQTIEKLESRSHEGLTKKSRNARAYQWTKGGETIDFVDYHARIDSPEFADRRSLLVGQLEDEGMLDGSGASIKDVGNRGDVGWSTHDDFDTIVALRPLDA